MELFKKIIGLMLAGLLCTQLVVFAATDISDMEDKKDDLQSQNEQLEEDQKKTQEEIEQKEQKQQELSAQLNELDAKIKDSRAKLLELESQIAQKEQDIEAVQQEVDKDTKNLQQRIKAIYMAGDTTNLEIILGAKDFTDFLDKLELVENISEHDSRLINDLKDSMAALNDEKAQLETAKQAQEEEQAYLDGEQASYQQLAEENKELLNELYDVKVKTGEELDQNNAELKKLEKEIKEYYEEQKRKAEEEKNARRKHRRIKIQIPAEALPRQIRVTLRLRVRATSGRLPGTRFLPPFGTRTAATGTTARSTLPAETSSERKRFPRRTVRLSLHTPAVRTTGASR